VLRDNLRCNRRRSRKNREDKCLTVLEDDKCKLAISGAKPDIASQYPNEKGDRCEAVPEYR